MGVDDCVSVVGIGCIRRCEWVVVYVCGCVDVGGGWGL